MKLFLFSVILCFIGFNANASIDAKTDDNRKPIVVEARTYSEGKPVVAEAKTNENRKSITIDVSDVRMDEDGVLIESFRKCRTCHATNRDGITAKGLCINKSYVLW